MTDETKILFTGVKSIFPFTGITPLVYNGGIVSSPYWNYDADIYYIALRVYFGSYGDTLGTGGNVTFYNQLNAIIYTDKFQHLYWDGNANVVKHAAHYELENIAFSRINSMNIGSTNFVGYKLTK